MKVLCGRAMAFGLILTVLLAGMPKATADSVYAEKSISGTADSKVNGNGNDYAVYLERYEKATPANGSIVCDASGAAQGEYQLEEDFRETGETALLLSEGETASWNIVISSPGYYQIMIRYYAGADSQSTPYQASLQLDGTVPYEEMGLLELSRMWRSETPDPAQDRYGNDLLPKQVQIEGWRETVLWDSEGYYQQPLWIYMEAGEHQISLSAVQNPLVLGSMLLEGAVLLPSYEEKLAEWEAMGAKAADQSLSLEAEDTSAKSSQSLVPVNDRTSPETSPYDPMLVKYNTIGSDRWKTPGEWIEWVIEVPEEGLYTLALRWKQNQKVNDVSVRALYIDGELPFQEAASLYFPYDGSWQYTRLGGNTPYQFYLEKGSHTIRLEARLGDYSETLRQTEELIQALNQTYLDIVVVTGPNPDANRDYAFEKLIPDVIEEMGNLAEPLKALRDQLYVLSGGGQNTAAFDRVILQLERMVEKPSSISQRLIPFKDSVSALATWMISAMEQPLELDTISLMPLSEPLPRGEANVWRLFLHYLKQFILSYQFDYSSIGGIDGDVNDTITIWMGSSTAAVASTTNAGRDQAQILKQMAYRFTEDSGIGVNVQLVNTGSLLPATLAGLGPDVALGQAQTEPVNLALRHAIKDLTEMPDIEQVLSEFDQSALIPFRFDGGLYAIPETMSYPMLYVRTDIMQKLGIELDSLETWEDILQGVLPTLQNNYLNFGVPADLNGFAIFLFQNGGTIYNSDGTASALNSMEAVAAFESFTELYTDYKQPLTFDFANRFRSGEMPLAISDLTSYNQLAVFAPEIKGLWTMLPVPGTKTEDGQVNHAAPATVTGSVIMSDSDSVPAAWKFIRWWSSAETQTQYAQELETLLGAAARYPVANREAATKISWDSRTRESLLEQRGWVQAIPEVPGGYFTTRHFSFAFRDVAVDGKDARESLNSAASNIDKEIANKLDEFSRS